MPESKFDAKSPKAGWLVWGLNLPILGLGNVYARGAGSWRWLLAGVGIQMILNWLHSGFGAWLACYVLLCVLGLRDLKTHNLIAEKNRKLAARYDPKRGELEDGGASEYASKRFEKKLRQAEQALKQMEEQAPQKGTTQAVGTQKSTPSPERAAPERRPGNQGGKAAVRQAAELQASDLADYVAQLSPLETVQSPAGERAGEGTQGDYGYAFFTSPVSEYADLGKLPDFYKFASADETALQDYVRCPGCGARLKVGEASCAACRPLEQV